MYLDAARGAVLVADNCRGMTPAHVERVVSNVGLSGKAGVSWLNGRFGFGMHAFRAAAEKLVVMTRSEDEARGIWLAVERASPEALAGNIEAPKEVGSWVKGGTGSQILLEGVDKFWMKELSKSGIAREVEIHFERLLARQGFHVFVCEADLGPVLEMSKKRKFDVDMESAVKEVHSRYQCQPFDYAQVVGKEFNKTFKIGQERVCVQLKISNKEYSGHRARFFAVDRRINEVSNISSFMRLSKFKSGLWAHPQLIGFIDVGSVVEPVITRDEFRISEHREALYSKLLDLEQALKNAVDKEMEVYRNTQLGGFEGKISKLLSKLAKREDKGEFPHKAENSHENLEVSQSSPNEEEKQKEPISRKEKKEDSTPKEAKIPEFSVQFAELPTNDQGDLKRYLQIDHVFIINSKHPDFVSRLRSRHGKPIYDERFIAYVATLLSAHFRGVRYTEKGLLNGGGDDIKHIGVTKIFDDMIDTYTVIEKELRRQLPYFKRMEFLDE